MQDVPVKAQPIRVVGVLSVMNMFAVLLSVGFVAVVVPFPVAAQRPEPWLRISRYDADGDGMVTAQEFRGPAWVMRRFDRDGDGALTREEVLAAGPGRQQRRGSGGADSAPRVGDDAPAVGARRPGTDEMISLSEPARATVLVFGSHT